ncbi:putative CRISPR-associated protein [Caldivirga sp. UBA161]|uniref:putative CRISPR-associated protein n=1 Tax=Caldivirga sp. UBA161 TaxID=1915569 RepID=UPI0025B98ACB|nr:putative CRISPR-associated protein [Caldivirga sp. UBA161]
MATYVAVIVGVSLLRNAVNSGFISEKYAMVIKNALEGDFNSDKKLGAIGFNTDLLSELREFIKGNVMGCCAELGTLMAFSSGIGDNIDVEFFYTDTKTTWLSALVLSNCLNECGITHGVNVIGSTQVPLFGGSDLDEGLASLVNVVGKKLASRISRGDDAYVAFTGGTKIEAVLVSMVAWLIGARPIYLMEGGPLIVLPRLPVNLNGSVINALCSAVGGNINANDAQGLIRFGLINATKDGYKVPKWVDALLKVKGLC